LSGVTKRIDTVRILSCGASFPMLAYYIGEPRRMHHLLDIISDQIRAWHGEYHAQIANTPTIQATVQPAT
jgi:hypothetical protein